MSDTFDPYHKWLGIPHSEQPPNHYRLLGIAKFETDADVIDAAAEQRMTFLQSLALGEHADHSQRLLNEVSQARLCLLNAAAKAEYDGRLQPVPSDANEFSFLEGASQPPADAAPDFHGISDSPAAQPVHPDTKSAPPALPTATSQPASEPVEEEIRSGRIPVWVWIAIGSSAAAVLALIVVVIIKLTSTDLREELRAAGEGMIKLEWPRAERTGSVLEIDGKEHPVSNTEDIEFRLKAGDHKLRIDREGFNPIFKEFSLGKGQIARMTIRWTPR